MGQTLSLKEKDDVEYYWRWEETTGFGFGRVSTPVTVFRATAVVIQQVHCSVLHQEHLVWLPSRRNLSV